ncbi:hypothetical protein GCM10011321_04580 [Youhaiella tibetensis]|uniref:Uncharacterized protein n=1 Tax=Paradevosia tibetensis TaxID=1447062 RepID=A0A5B9DPM5_9HYPH|nr:hypothetical protein [Youhaiella tibetensis]QEE21351.1 hypothetical protein FNA67_14650 [Youhaiella tibetensis]GGF15808.1 hypothetical protein GCM10011321_04580 [Youhaiella tibetensis]
MSSAFVREGGGETPRVWQSRESAAESLATWRTIDGQHYNYEIRARPHGGFMIARLNKSGGFDSWVSD